jgi:FMN-dependent NADH-azoreductase
MANLLFVASSLFGDGSQSRLIASEFIDRWRQSHPFGEQQGSKA